MAIEKKRHIVKRSNNPGVVPTVPATNDHTDGTWLTTDIYKGEIFTNLADGKMFTRFDSGIFQLPTSPGSGIDITNGVISLNIENYTQNIIQLTGVSYLGLNGGNTEISSDTNLSLYAQNGQIYGQASGDVAFIAQGGTVALMGQAISVLADEDATISAHGGNSYLNLLSTASQLGRGIGLINIQDPGWIFATGELFDVDIFGEINFNSSDSIEFFIGGVDKVFINDWMTLIKNTLNLDSLNENTILELDGNKDVISVAKNDAYNKNFGTISGTVCEGQNGVITQKFSLSSAQILTLNSSPVTLLAAPGAGKSYELLGVLAQLNFVTSAYATNTTLNIRFMGATLVSAQNASILASTVSRRGRIALTAASATTSTQYLDNTAIQVDVGTGNPTAGDGTLDIYLTYKIINV